MILAYVPDLMDRSRLAGFDVHFVGRLEDLAGAGAGAADVVVADLSRPGALDALIDLGGDPAGPRLVGFTNHTDRAVLDAAAAAGVAAMPRSAFFGRPADHLGPTA